MTDLSLSLDDGESIEVFVDITNGQAFNKTFCIHISKDESDGATISIPDKSNDFDIAKIRITNNGEIVMLNYERKECKQYTEVMKDLFGQDWCCDQRVLSKEAESSCHMVYNYLTRE